MVFRKSAPRVATWGGKKCTRSPSILCTVCIFLRGQKRASVWLSDRNSWEWCEGDGPNSRLVCRIEIPASKIRCFDLICGGNAMSCKIPQFTTHLQDNLLMHSRMALIEGWFGFRCHSMPMGKKSKGKKGRTNWWHFNWTLKNDSIVNIF